MADDVQFQASLDDDEVIKALNRIDKRIDKVADDGQRSFDKLDKSANKAGKTIGSSFDSAGAKLLGAIGTVTALAAAVKELTDAAIESEKANFNLSRSAAAAAREFGTGVGTSQTWRSTLSELRDETRIYSESELANATSRLIDMTKRLGLTEEQMQETLRRTIDLSAGKVDLQGGIERVTAALRGEAESAEFLGLALNETNVRAYAEAQGLVWKELSDGEKAQLRYALLLEQTNETQGRAAQFAETLAGKEAALNAKLEDQASILGEQLLPLREGYVELISRLSDETEGSASVVSKGLAAIAASFVSLGATATAVVLNTIEGLKALGNITVITFDSIKNLENPLDAIQGEVDRFNQAVVNSNMAIANYGDTWDSAFEQILDGWAEQRRQAQQTSDDLAGTDIVIDEDGIEINTEELEKALEKLTDLERDAFRKRIDIIRSNAQKAADLELDFAQKRIDAARDYARELEDIERKNAQSIEDSSRDLRRDEADALRDYNRERAELEKDSAKERIKVEEDYRDEIRRINQNFQDSADEAARNRDAVTLLRLQRQRDRQIEEAKITRTKRVEEAQGEAQERQEELRISLQQQLEDARIADERRLEDLRIRLDREFEEARINRERDLQDIQIAEDRKQRELQQSLDRQLRDAEVANNRRVSDFKDSLSEEVRAQLKAEQEKTEIVRREAATRSSIYQQQIDEAQQARKRFTVPEYLRSPGRQFGGPVGAGQTVTVGEAGPELFTPRIAGNVIPLQPGITSPLGAQNISNVVNNVTNASVNQSMLDPTQQSAMMRAIAANVAAETVRRIISG